MRSIPNVAPRAADGKGSLIPDSYNSAETVAKSPKWLIGGRATCTAKGNSAARIAPGYGGSVFRDAGNSGRVATDQAARKALQAQQAAGAGGAKFPLSGRYDPKSQSIQARGSAKLKTERAAVCKTAAPRHR